MRRDANTESSTRRPAATRPEILELAADRITSPDVIRYGAALRGNAAYLADRDSQTQRD
jgi:hypothetical protein